MNCTEYQKQIAIADVLSPEELVEVKQHVDNCPACAKAWQAMIIYQESIQQLATMKDIPNHNAQLTTHIMAGITTRATRNSWRDQVSRWVMIAPVRYTMAMVSLVLLVAFGAESFTTHEITKPIQPSENTVTLNSSVFKRLMLEQRNHKSLLSNCASPFTSNQQSLKCLKNNFIK